jgi:hypothetical protein
MTANLDVQEFTSRVAVRVAGEASIFKDELVAGRLSLPRAYNQLLILSLRLPNGVRIEASWRHTVEA